MPLPEKFPVPWIGWIPDFQHKHLPHFFPEKDRLQRDSVFSDLSEKADHLVVSSDNALRDLEKWFPCPRASALPFLTMPEPSWFDGSPQSVAKNYGLPEKFIIFPSKFYTHKNHINLIKALSLLQSKGTCIPLVTTGVTFDERSPDHQNRINNLISDLNLGEQVFNLGMLPRLDQIQLLRRAAAIVQPSLFEGWSALLEDGRVLGKDMLASDLPIHREQSPPHTTFFDPHDPQDIAHSLEARWPQLRPGPDLERERIAREKNSLASREFALSFLEIVDSAIAHRRKRDPALQGTFPIP